MHETDTVKHHLTITSVSLASQHGAYSEQDNKSTM